MFYVATYVYCQNLDDNYRAPPNEVTFLLLIPFISWHYFLILFSFAFSLVPSNHQTRAGVASRSSTCPYLGHNAPAISSVMDGPSLIISPAPSTLKRKALASKIPTGKVSTRQVKKRSKATADAPGTTDNVSTIAGVLIDAVKVPINFLSSSLWRLCFHHLSPLFSPRVY